MRFINLLFAVFGSTAITATIPKDTEKTGKYKLIKLVVWVLIPSTAAISKRFPAVEGAGASGSDDDDAIAYAWYAEDETPKLSGISDRSIEVAGKSGADDDDAIAYAWYAEDAQSVKE